MPVCPNCRSEGMTLCYEAREVPIHSCLLLPTREQAEAFPRGDVVLAVCQRCGFLSNVAFDPRRLDYSPQYEDQQCFSACFNVFAGDLARRLVEKYDLHNKRIMEIGCGKGDFLALLCRLGNNYGVGIDPACRADRLTPEDACRLTLIQDFFSETQADPEADFVCCRHVLEHIPNPADFLGAVRRGIVRPKVTVFCEVPDAQRLLTEGAFWDIYYEHCSYFTPVSLRFLFQSNGFNMLEIARDFADQYILLEAKADSSGEIEEAPKMESQASWVEAVAHFKSLCEQKQRAWQEMVAARGRAGKRVVIWGSGSKGVAFLTGLGGPKAVEFAVDINPHRQGKYMPGVGAQIVAPEFLQEYRPDLIIIMNPIYHEEIACQCQSLGLEAEIVDL